MNLTILNTGQIRPAHNSDMPIFLHCSGGLISVTEQYWESEIKEVLTLHLSSENSQPIYQYFDERGVFIK